jgi:nitroreductase
MASCAGGTVEVWEAIRTKRAVRQFAARPIPPQVLEQILRAGHHAQSSKNTQPWQFIAVQERTRLEALSKLGPYAGHLAGAACAIVIATPDPAQRWSILFDAGQAAAYMQLAAWGLGVGSCLATLYETENARTLLGIPADWHVHVAISFGYPEDPGLLSMPPRSGGRKPLREGVHYDAWGNHEPGGNAA